MKDEAQVALTVIIGTLLLLMMISTVVLLMVLNRNRRNRHRAALAELHLLRQSELAQAAREATEQTLAEVGRELHDNVGQLLTVAHIGLMDRLEGEVNTDPQVATTLAALDEGIEEVRRLGRTLNSDLWQRRGLIEALETEAVRIERLGRAAVHLSISGKPVDPPPDVRTILFRAFQEVVNNALKHSGADILTIHIDTEPTFSLTITDNGRGFDATRQTPGSGLLNIRQRCALIGYRCALRTSAGQGCSWTFTPETNTDEPDSPGR